MLKQLTYLVARDLFQSEQPGVRLAPIVVFVQRIVRLLRDTNTNMKKMVRKRSLFPWYIKQAHKKADANMLLQAYEQCGAVSGVKHVPRLSFPGMTYVSLPALAALVIMMDGVDEAAGERDTVEARHLADLPPNWCCHLAGAVT